MSRCAAFFITLVVLTGPTSSWSENASLRLCTGSPNGNYHAAGEQISRQVTRQNLTVTLIGTDGSMDNMRKMASGECDAGFAQIDAYLHYQAINEDSRLEVEWPRQLYGEYVHLVCRRDAAIESVEDLRRSGQSHTLIVSAPGSGSAITWDSMARLRPDYLDIATRTTDDAEALQAISDGDASCMLFVSGLNSGYLAQIDAAGEQLKLVPVVDKAFREAEHFGKPIYDFRSIPKDTYRALQAPTGDPVETLVVNAVILISRAWAADHVIGYETLIDGVKRATPVIRERVSAP